MDAGDLARELGADRAAGAGDEHEPVLEVGADAVELHHHRVAAEHVLDLDLAQLAGELDAAAQELEDGRQRAHRDVALAAGGDDLRRAGRPGADGIAITTSSGLVRSRIAPISSVVPSTWSPRLRMPRFARVVVDEADRAAAEVRVELQLADDHLAARAGADDQHRRAPCGAARPAVGRSRSSGAASRAPPASRRQEHEVEDDDRAAARLVGVTAGRSTKTSDQIRPRRATTSGADTAARGRAGGSSATTSVLAEQLEDQRLADRDERDRAERACPRSAPGSPGTSRKRSLKASAKARAASSASAPNCERAAPVDGMGSRRRDIAGRV